MVASDYSGIVEHFIEFHLFDGAYKILEIFKTPSEKLTIDFVDQHLEYAEPLNELSQFIINN